MTSEDSQRFLETHQEVLDGETAFARQMQLRQAAKEASIFLHGCLLEIVGIYVAKDHTCKGFVFGW